MAAPYKATTVDSILKERQLQVDAMRQSGELPQAQVPQEPKPFTPLGVEVTPDYQGKSFGRKVGEDLATLAYAIPVGIAKIVTDPVTTGKELPGGIVQSTRDLVDPDYYKAHPALGVVNALGYVTGLGGLLKSVTVNAALKGAIAVGTREAISAGLAKATVQSLFKDVSKGFFTTQPFRQAVNEAVRTGKTQIVAEVVSNMVRKAGGTAEQAIRVGSAVSDNLYTTLSRHATRDKAIEAMAHPLRATAGAVSKATNPLRQALFGNPAASAVARLYGEDVVAKNPEGFLNIERWAEAQVKERGFDNTVDNRQRMMMEWVDQNSQWASLTPEERIAHFNNYARQDLVRRELHNQTGIDMVTTKALPQNYVEAMVQTIKELPEDLDITQVMKRLEEEFGNDFMMHSDEILSAIAKNGTREGLIAVIGKLGKARSLISFAKFSPEVQQLAKQLEKTGYRIGYAPKDKQVSFVSDVFGGVDDAGVPTAKAKIANSMVESGDLAMQRTALGRFFEKIGLSPNGVIEGAPEFAYRESITQKILTKFAEKHGTKGGNIKIGSVYMPLEKIFEWLDNRKVLLQEARPRASLPIRTVYDIKADDLVRAGMKADAAADLASILRTSIRDVPTSVTGMGDAVVNFLKSGDKGFAGWMSTVFDNYLKAAYKGRYDWSPFFSAQQFIETRLQSAMFLKDIRQVPGGKGIAKLGNWTASKLSKELVDKKSYLREIIEEPPIEDVAAVRDEVLGSLQKTMLDYTSSPDLINIQNSARNGIGGLRDKAAFEKSIRSRNLWYAAFGQSTVRMATNFNKALATKFGMDLKEALSYTVENGSKKYKHPEMVQMMRDATQSVFHYKQGFLTSPLAKTMNLIWFPFRFQAKTAALTARWLGSLSPASRLIVMNNWVHFANWAQTEEGKQWRLRNRNVLYNLVAYTTAYEQMGQSAAAVAKGRLFGGNTGLIGGVPFGFMVNLARELGYAPEDPDQFDPKTGRQFTKNIPREPVSAASLAVALEQLLISVSPSTPFYSLTGGVISGVSPRKWIESLVRQVVGSTKEAIEGGRPEKGRQRLENQFRRVPLDYNRDLFE
jgi:hypothetical protein